MKYGLSFVAFAFHASHTGERYDLCHLLNCPLQILVLFLLSLWLVFLFTLACNQFKGISKSLFFFFGRSPDDKNVLEVATYNKAISQSFENLLDDSNYGLVQVREFHIGMRGNYIDVLNLKNWRTQSYQCTAQTQFLSTEIEKGSLHNNFGWFL